MGRLVSFWNSIGNWFSGAWNSVSNWFSNNWQWVVGVVAVGLLALSVVTFGATAVLAGALIGLIVGGVGSAVTQKLTTGSIDWVQAVKAGLIGAVIGGISGGIGSLSQTALQGTATVAQVAVHLAIQMGVNGVLSASAYAIQSVIEGNSMTLIGMRNSIIAGMIAGGLFDLKFLSSIILSISMEAIGNWQIQTNKPNVPSAPGLSGNK